MRDSRVLRADSGWGARDAAARGAQRPA
jgi:hypothetical protein